MLDPNAGNQKNPPQVAGPLPPGSTIGILGSGQLGRMLALAGARLGLKSHIYADASGPAFDVAATHTVGGFDDMAALARFGGSVDVVTYEFENVPVAAAEALQKIVAVRPGPRALEVSQDRLIEKQFISALGVPVAPFMPIASAADIGPAMLELGGPAILKTRRLGYDGKGQVSVASADRAAGAFDAIGRAPAVLEKRVAFTREVSVLVVRAVDGTLAYYDCPENEHRDGILHRSTVPSPLGAADVAQAQAIAGRIATALAYVGVLAVELFHFADRKTDRLAVNEIAPRVHNSGHWTMDACAISQFENHMRAVAGWPLGSTARHSDAEMINLIGAEANAWHGLAAEPGAALHLYGKREARDGRKMGHVNRLQPRR